jgi:hypothetical protein
LFLEARRRAAWSELRISAKPGPVAKKSPNWLVDTINKRGSPPDEVI